LRAPDPALLGFISKAKSSSRDFHHILVKKIAKILILCSFWKAALSKY
jgi:hypothetical protein